MSISLVKGQKIDLTKGKAGLSKLLVGLGWDPIKKKKGLFGSISSANLDADASVLLLDETGKLVETVYYGNKISSNGSIRHSGDNLTGHGDGDDEQIVVDLQSIPAHVHRLVFTVNIYAAHSRKQDFGMVENAYIHIEDVNDHTDLARFNLTDDYSGKTAIIVGEIDRHGGEWKFSAVGQGTNDGSINEMSRHYR